MSTSSTGTESLAPPATALNAPPAWRSLRVRLALGMGLFAVLLTAALAVAIGELATNVARKEIGRYVTRLAIEMRDKLDLGMAERFAEVGTLVSLDSGFDGQRNAAMRRALLREFKKAAPEYHWIGYVDSGGRVLVGLDGLFEGQDVSDRNWFTAALGGPFVGDVHESRILPAVPTPRTQVPEVVDIAFPLKDAGGVRGVVAAQVDWKWAARLRDSIESYAQPDTPFELLVVGADGRVLLGPAALAGTRLPAGELIPSRLHSYEARLQRWADGMDYVVGSSSTRGFGASTGLGWGVIARQRVDFAFAPVRELQTRIALAGGFIALLALAFGWAMATRVSRPLIAISQAADAISQGSRRVEIPPGGSYAEIDRLSRSLRAMLRKLSIQEEDLRQAQDHLEARVRARTAELAKAKAEMELEAAERTLARDEARAAKDQLSLAMDASRLVLWDYNLRTGEVALSEGWSALLGGEPVATTETMASLTGLVPEEDRAAVQAAIASALRGPVSSYREEHRVRTASGSPIWIVSEGRVVERDASGRALRMVGTNRDITDRVRYTHALRESEERFRGAMESSPMGMAISDLDGRWLKANPALCRITGYTEAELQARTFRDITVTEDLAQALLRMRDLLDGKVESYEVQKRYVHKDGHEVWVQVNVSLMRDADGKPQHIISQVMDVSERRKLQEEVRHLALHDALTGLPNARLLADRMEQALAAARRTKEAAAVMYLDLDGFKPVNDTHGHAAGDLVLTEVGARLRKMLRETDTVARLGGDEFVVVLGRIGGESDARLAAERVLAAIATPFELGSAQAHLSASIGIALFPLHGADAQSLRQHADAAMYVAKRSGKNSYRFYAGETQ
ncbi:MAG: diguanylate cyclase [Betaproteobacteria bacterium]